MAFRKPETEEEIPVSSFAKEKVFKKKDKKGAAASAPVSKEHLNMAKSWLNDENSDKYFYWRKEQISGLFRSTTLMN